MLIISYQRYAGYSGAQFVRGFGGIGGLLRYRVDFATIDTEDADGDNINLDDY